MTPTPDPVAAADGTAPAPASGLVAIAATVVYLLVAVLAAVIEVLLVPVRIGTAVVPVSVLLAAVTMVVLPLLASTASGRTLGGFITVGAWIVTVVVLSQARPEGDVLLVGSAPLVYVTYGLLAAGAVCGIATVVMLDRHRLATAAAARLAATQAGGTTQARGATRAGSTSGAGTMTTGVGRADVTPVTGRPGQPPARPAARRRRR